MDNDAHVADLVRQGDPDRYLSALYAPPAKRAALLSLYAFALETAVIRDRVREPMAGEIRLQWWRDAISSGSGQGSPVAEALVTTIASHNLPRQTFLDLLEARIFDLYDDPMPSRNDLEGYCGETSSAVFQLAALILEPSSAREMATLSGHAGCAFGIARIARSLPRQLARGQCFVPLDLLSAAGLDRDGFVGRADREGAARAIAAFVALGREHANAFGAAASLIPVALRPVYLPAALVPAYLDAISARGAGAIDHTVDISPLRRHWLLLRHAMRGWKQPA